ncbi:MAG: biotin--[acetyl-CoA-carboxylase] ligase [Planctomycetota bacterium]
MNTDNEFYRINTRDARQLERSTFVRQVEHYSMLPSTNSQALQLATARRLNLPLLVLADEQTAGRGRSGNQWWSAPGALTFSLILERPESTDGASWLRIALTTGMAVCEALHQLCPGVNVALKWPNDVYVQGRKICGILVENPPRTGRRTVLGVGVNVNNRLDHAPASVRSWATSLAEVAGYPFGLSSVLIEILRQLSAHLVLLQHDPQLLQQRWDRFCLLAGKTIQLVSGSRKTTGQCLGINAAGALLLRTGTGITPCFSGEVVQWS